MTNKIIAQSARFRAVRTSRDRVRIKSATGKIEFASFRRANASSPWFAPNIPTTMGQDLKTFVEAVHRMLTQEAK